MLERKRDEKIKPGSHMLGLGLVMSIFIRSVASLAANLPTRISSNNFKFSSTVRSRQGELGFKSKEGLATFSLAISREALISSAV